MKRWMLLLLTALTLLLPASCAQGEKAAPMEPKASQMRSICELAVMDCYYHNVAKFKQENAENYIFWQKDKNFWIEYSGVVTLGVDASLVTMETEGDQVTITLPPAKVLSCKVDSSSLSKDSFIVAKDSAAIDASDEVEAFSEAQKNLEQDAAQDTVLLASAQQRVQSLLEDYVMNVGNMVGKQYSIRWVYLDADESAASGGTAPESDAVSEAAASSAE